MNPEAKGVLCPETASASFWLSPSHSPYQHFPYSPKKRTKGIVSLQSLKISSYNKQKPRRDTDEEKNLDPDGSIGLVSFGLFT